MARENPRWGQRRIQAELTGLRFAVCARTVARYMRRPNDGYPSPGWQRFLNQHADEIWACALFTVQTDWLQTLYVFFVIHHGTCQLIHPRVTAGLLRESVLHRYAQYCNVVRGRLLIDQ